MNWWACGCLGPAKSCCWSSEKGVIVRTSADAIPQQSRAATGVRLQKLDKGDRLLKVVLVPPQAEGDDDDADDGIDTDAVEADAVAAPETNAEAQDS